MAATSTSVAAGAGSAAHDPTALLRHAYALAWRGAPEALPALDEAWREAAARRHAAVAAQAAAAAICILDADYRDYRAFPAWAQRLADPPWVLRGEDPSARLLRYGALALCALHAGRDVSVRPGVPEVVSLLARATDADQALLGAAALIVPLHDARRERDSARIMVAAQEHARDAGPWTASHWASLCGQHALFSHRLDEADARLRDASAIAQRHGLRAVVVMATLMQARLAVAREDDHRVAGLLAGVEPVDDEREPMWRAVIHQLRSLTQLRAGRSHDALNASRLAIAWADRAAAPGAEAAPMRCLEGYCLAAGGDGFGAATALRDASRTGTRAQSRQARLMADLATADALAAAGRRDDALPYVATAIAEARALDYPAFFWAVPELASRVCALALSAGIATAYVRGVIRTRGLAAPPQPPAQWPWACSIEALGRFRVALAGRRMADELARTSTKPLELLRAIVALGGRHVAVDRLVALLWPGKGRVGARSAFNVTLLRLRRLLGDDTLVAMSANVVSLDAGRVDVDRWRLESALAAAEGSTVADRRDALATLVACYAGPLLPDDEAGWMEAERRRLRLRVDAALAHGASQLAPVEAGSLLSRALAADPELPLAAGVLQSVTHALRPSGTRRRRRPSEE
ncbi:MAG: hypothetical protein U1F10_04490 [Burkholderiales bacterium]